VFCVLLVIVDY